MTTPVFQVLDDLGTQEFMRIVLTVIDEHFTSYTTTTVNTLHCSDDEMPTAQAALTLSTQADNIRISVNDKLDTAYEAINEVREDIYKLSHLTFQIVTGPISNIDDPKPDVIYLQHNDPADIKWVLYVYDNEWLAVGIFTRDFSNYWSKDNTDSDVLEFRARVFEPITRARLHEAVTRAREEVAGT